MDDYTPQPVDGLTGSAQADHVLSFVGRTHLADIPETVRAHARYLLLDLIGVAAVGVAHPWRIISKIRCNKYGRRGWFVLCADFV